MKFFRVAIIGSRDFPAPHLVRRGVRTLYDLIAVPWKVISGAARGPDKIAAATARRLGVPVVELPADWERGGGRAGFDRNSDIVARAQLVLAFWDGESPGTRDSIQKAIRLGKPVWIIYPDGSMEEVET